jgi:hypothetical protein
MTPALMTRTDLRSWFAGLGLTPQEGRQVVRRACLCHPLTFTTPQGDYWTILPLVTGAYLVSPGLPPQVAAEAFPTYLPCGCAVGACDCDDQEDR